MNQSAADRLKRIEPGWMTSEPAEVMIRHRSGSVSSRRAYPVAHNGPFVPHNLKGKGFALESVGIGNDVYLEPDEDAKAGSEEAKHRVKRLKNVGAAAQLLVEQDEGDLTNELRTVQAKAGALLEVVQENETLDIDSTGVTGDITIGADGQLGTTRGIVHTLLPGTPGASYNVELLTVSLVVALTGEIAVDPIGFPLVWYIRNGIHIGADDGAPVGTYRVIGRILNYGTGVPEDSGELYVAP